VSNCVTLNSPSGEQSAHERERRRCSEWFRYDQLLNRHDLVVDGTGTLMHTADQRRAQTRIGSGAEGKSVKMSRAWQRETHMRR
jgi:hypothetical protein